MSTDTFRLHYLAKTAAGIPRDLANSWVVSRFKAIRPTVLIYNCTFVCDARCEMCGNWKMGDRKSDMTLEQLDGVMAHDFWGAVENLNISGGEPTTRNDLPEMVELFQRRLPRMRKIGINTTGLTPHRAIPMLTRIVKFCAEHDLLLSVRVSLDGIGDIHNQVRQVKPGFDKACETIEAMQALAKEHSNFQFGLAATIFATNLQDAENILAWSKEQGPGHRVQHAAVHREHAEQQEPAGHHRLPQARRRLHAEVLPRSRVGRVGVQRPGVHVSALRRHDCQRVSPHHALPVPEPGPAAEPGRQPLLLRELREARQRAG